MNQANLASHIQCWLDS